MIELNFKSVDALHYVYNRARGWYKSRGMTHEGMRLSGKSILVDDAFAGMHVRKLADLADRINADYRLNGIRETAVTSSS